MKLSMPLLLATMASCTAQQHRLLEEPSYLRKLRKPADVETVQKVIKEVVLSSLLSEDGKVDSEKMEKARDVGFAFEEVHHLVKLARAQGDAKEIENFLEGVKIIPKEATQDAFHHVEISSKKEDDAPSTETTPQDEPTTQDEKKTKISGPRVMADAIESAVNSETGDVDPEALQLAVESGWTRQEVEHMARLALKSIHDHDGDKTRVLNDLRRLRELKEQKRPPKEERLTGQTWTGYKPKGGWTMTFKEHRALSKAVLTAIRSPPNHDVDPVALEEAIKEGVARETVMEAIDSALVNIDTALEKKRLRLLKAEEK